MSIFIPAEATCRKCGTVTEINLAASVNAARRPDLRAQIIDGSFQAQDCPNCGTRLRLPAHMTYIDVPRSQWILVEDVTRLDDWRAVEEEARAVFDQSFGPGASDAAQEIGRELQARLVFGWIALREKLIAAEFGVDDVILELAKISAIRNIDGSPMADTTELRMVGGGATTLELRWFDSLTEAQIATLNLPRELYKDLAESVAEEPGWQTLKADVSAGLLVDMKRLVFA